MMDVLPAEGPLVLSAGAKNLNNAKEDAAEVAVWLVSIVASARWMWVLKCM
jgi:hypothetical protein